MGAGLHLETGENGEQDVLALSPDGVTTTVDEGGLLSALGGNLLLNAEEWITESCTWVAPVTGWYEVLVIDGGSAGTAHGETWDTYARGGDSGARKRHLVYLGAGEETPVIIGAGGSANGDYPNLVAGGSASSFGSLTSQGEGVYRGSDCPRYTQDLVNISKNPSIFSLGGTGGGPGGGSGNFAGFDPAAVGGFHYVAHSDGRWYGAGGGAYWHHTKGFCSAGNGAQGAVHLRWHDPARAGGPGPARMALRRRAVRAVSIPAVVNLYDPETGQGSVWRAENADTKLAEGMITEAAWREMCAAKAAEERAAWLVSPETEAERFEMLRAARDAKLAGTDYLVAADYPLGEEERAAVIAYRQALRDLPAQEGAPWDGGGEGTPWPAAPACCGKAPAEGENTCA